MNSPTEILPAQIPDANLIQLPEYQLAAELLQERKLIMATPKGKEEVKIQEVYPYMGLAKPSQQEAFDLLERNKGEFFITFERGFAQLNVVVDPAKRSVICLKTFKQGGLEQLALNALLKKIDLARNNFSAGEKGMEEYQEKILSTFDGVPAIDGQGVLSLPKMSQSEILGAIARDPEGVSKLCLGRFYVTEEIKNLGIKI